MGHQLNFYALPSDIAEIEEAILRTGDVAILHSRSPSSNPRIVESTDLKEYEKQWLFFYVVRRSDIFNVATRHVPAQGYWIVDDTRSPVIEFTRCYFDGVILRRGRVWYADGYYGSDGDWVNKGEPFREWGKEVLRAVRNCLSKLNGDYVGPAANTWGKSGGRFVQS